MFDMKSLFQTRDFTCQTIMQGVCAWLQRNGIFEMNITEHYKESPSSLSILLYCRYGERHKLKRIIGILCVANEKTKTIINV